MKVIDTFRLEMFMKHFKREYGVDIHISANNVGQVMLRTRWDPVLTAYYDSKTMDWDISVHIASMRTMLLKEFMDILETAFDD